jgi:hypothetical protein
MHGRQDFGGFFLGKVGKSGVRSCHFNFVVMPIFFLGFRQGIELRRGNDVFEANRLVLVFHAGGKNHADKGAIILGFAVMITTTCNLGSWTLCLIACICKSLKP